MKKMLCLLMIFTMILTSAPAGFAADESLTRGAASLLIPGWGQYLNGELETQSGKVKTGAMILLEIGAIVTTAMVGGMAGYPQVWAGLGIFLFNHIWSASDAYMKAPAGPEVALKEPSVSQR